MADRYELPANPSFYDALKTGKVPLYHYESLESIRPGSIGNNGNNISRLLKDIKSGDSLIFKVGEEERKKLGLKGVEYEDELEKIVGRIEKKGDFVYLYFK